MQRFGQADEIAAAASFLVSDRPTWLTGQVIAIDGGALVADALPTDLRGLVNEDMRTRTKSSSGVPDTPDWGLCARSPAAPSSSSSAAWRTTRTRPARTRWNSSARRRRACSSPRTRRRSTRSTRTSSCTPPVRCRTRPSSQEEMVRLLSSGKNVVTTTAYHFPWQRGEDYVAPLEEACRIGGNDPARNRCAPGMVHRAPGPDLDGSQHRRQRGAPARDRRHQPHAGRGDLGHRLRHEARASRQEDPQDDPEQVLLRDHRRPVAHAWASGSRR